MFSFFYPTFFNAFLQPKLSLTVLTPNHTFRNISCFYLILLTVDITDESCLFSPAMHFQLPVFSDSEYLLQSAPRVEHHCNRVQLERGGGGVSANSSPQTLFSIPLSMPYTPDFSAFYDFSKHVAKYTWNLTYSGSLDNFCFMFNKKS